MTRQEVAMNEVRVLPARRRVDVDTYYRMAELGLFGEGQRVELIEGDVIDMSPIGQGHESVVNRLTESLVLASGGRAIVSVQNSVRLDGFSAPQPDFALLRRRADFYGSGERAGPGDVLLLIEVSESSAAYDRTVKLGLYARAGIGEYWIVDVQARTLEAYSVPGAAGYEVVRRYGPGDVMALVLAPEIVVGFDAAFG